MRKSFHFRKNETISRFLLGRPDGVVDGQADAEMNIIVRIPRDRNPVGRHVLPCPAGRSMAPRRSVGLLHLHMAAQTGLEPRASFGAIRSGDTAVCRAGRIDRDNAMRAVAQLHAFRKSVPHGVEHLAQFLFQLLLFCHVLLSFNGWFFYSPAPSWQAIPKIHNMPPSAHFHLSLSTTNLNINRHMGDFKQCPPSCGKYPALPRHFMAVNSHGGRKSASWFERR